MENAKPTGPYTSFQSIMAVLKDLKTNGTPNRIDRSVLTNFSGAVGSQIMTALRFLALTNDAGRPTQNMVDLVESWGTEDWSSNLSKVIRSAYPPLFEIDLENASPKEFNDQFRVAYSGTEEVRRKSITFFINATREAEIPISSYILKNKKPRSAPTKKRTPKKKVSETLENDGGLPPPSKTDKKPSQGLLELLDMTNMDDEEQQALWLLIRFFKGRDE